MLTILKNITTALVAIPTLFSVIKSINKYFKQHPKSNIKIYGRSLIMSFLCTVVVHILMMFMYSKIYYGDYKLESFRGIYSFIEVTIFILILVAFCLFWVKDIYITNYAFLLAADYKKKNEQNNEFSIYSNNTLNDISKSIVNDDFKVNARLEKLKKTENNIYQKRRLTKSYDYIKIFSWFAFPLLMTQFYIGLFTSFKGIDLVILLIFSLIPFILFNSFIIYHDLKLESGKVTPTNKMIKKHIYHYEKMINKN